jgi:four helix bundle protein
MINYLETNNILEEGNAKLYDLEDRLIEFAILVLNIAELLPSDRTGSHIAAQMIRSGTSPALNYGEAQSAESKNDFYIK